MTDGAAATVVELESVSARGPAERGRPRAVLAGVTLTAGPGVLAIVGTVADGAALLLDVVDGTASARSGSVRVLGQPPGRSRSVVARVSIDAPLPESLRVAEACALSSALRGEAQRPARERLEAFGAGGLADRTIVTLSAAERRTVALAIALTSGAKVLLLDEPLVALEPQATSGVAERIRERARTDCVVLTTASAVDARRLGTRVARLRAGVLGALEGASGPERASIAVVVGAAAARTGASLLAQGLGAERAVTEVDTSLYAGDAGALVVARGPDLGAVAAAVTRVIAASAIDVERIEPAEPLRPRGSAPAPPRGAG